MGDNFRRWTGPGIVILLEAVLQIGGYQNVPLSVALAMIAVGWGYWALVTHPWAVEVVPTLWRRRMSMAVAVSVFLIPVFAWWTQPTPKEPRISFYVPLQQFKFTEGQTDVPGMEGMPWKEEFRPYRLFIQAEQGSATIHDLYVELYLPGQGVIIKKEVGDLSRASGARLQGRGETQMAWKTQGGRVVKNYEVDTNDLHLEVDEIRPGGSVEVKFVVDFSGVTEPEKMKTTGSLWSKYQYGPGESAEDRPHKQTAFRIAINDYYQAAFALQTPVPGAIGSGNIVMRPRVPIPFEAPTRGYRCAPPDQLMSEMCPVPMCYEIAF